MSRFDTLLAASQTALRSFAGQTVLLSRGAQTGSALAVQTRRPYEAQEESGLVTVVLSEDFLVAAADYQIGGAAVEPAVGDRIEIVSGDVFEVVPLAGGYHFDWRDAAKTEMRVHTKRVVAG
jgi:hypothetical protein